MIIVYFGIEFGVWGREHVMFIMFRDLFVTVGGDFLWCQRQRLLVSHIFYVLLDSGRRLRKIIYALFSFEEDTSFAHVFCPPPTPRPLWNSLEPKT